MRFGWDRGVIWDLWVLFGGAGRDPIYGTTYYSESRREALPTPGLYYIGYLIHHGCPNLIYIIIYNYNLMTISRSLANNTNEEQHSDDGRWEPAGPSHDEADEQLERYTDGLWEQTAAEEDEELKAIHAALFGHPFPRRG